MKNLGLLISIIFLNGYLKDLSALDEKWPIVAFERGSVAQIPCMVRGETKAYFWRKGSSYNNSKHLAANVHGVADEFANSTQGKLTVAANGSLFIYDISPEDDDTYFCRVVTQTSEYHGGVVIYSQALFESFLTIEQCQTKLSCILYLEPFSTHRFTCTARYVSSMVDVKWSENNGTVIMSSSDYLKNTDGSYNISRTVQLTYDEPTVLSCEALSPAAGGDFVQVRLETVSRQDAAETTDVYVVAFLVTLIAALITIVTIIAVFYIYASKRNKEKAKTNDEEAVPLKESVSAELAESKDKLQKTEDKLASLADRNKKIERERDLLLRDKKNLHLDLELSERKYRTDLPKIKEKQKVFLRIKPHDNNPSFPTSGDNEMKAWKNLYNFTKIFQQDANQETVFADTGTADLVQGAVDGGKTLVIAFGGPNSGRRYTMKGQENNPGIHAATGLIPRAVHKVFEIVDDLKDKKIEVKVTASRLKSYETSKDNVVNFIELSYLDPEKDVFYKVQGLKVAMKVYMVTKSQEVLDLLWGESSEDKVETGTETCDLLQIYIETLKDSKSVSKGSLCFAMLSTKEASKQLTGEQVGNRSVRPLLESFLKEDNSNIVILSNIASDKREDAKATLDAVSKIKIGKKKTSEKETAEHLKIFND